MSRGGRAELENSIHSKKLSALLSRAINVALNPTARSDSEISVLPTERVEQVEATVEQLGLRLDRVLAEAALGAARAFLGISERTVRKRLEFIVANKRTPQQLSYTIGGSAPLSIKPRVLRDALIISNRTIELIHDLSLTNNVPIFALLGLRNLSSFVGQVFARELCGIERDRLMLNPHQDGYPDLMALTSEGLKYLEERKERGEISAKQFWSPYPFGGIEVKATCGSTPPARIRPKLDIGESRLPYVVGADWKAHHRLTNNLLALFWDFVEQIPTVLAAFYRNDLTQDDWQAIVQPKEGGGRTTSVSIMSRKGIEKMIQGWVVLPASPDLLSALKKIRGFRLTDDTIAAWRS